MGKSKSKSSRKRAPNRLEHLNTVPDVVEVLVELPSFNNNRCGGNANAGDVADEVDVERTLELRCVSTDTLVDVRVMLSELPDTCHFTNYSLKHAVRGDRLKRDLEVVSLKPNVVSIVEEKYSEAAARAQVQRFIDLFTCTNHVGPVAKKKPKPSNSWLSDSTDKQKLSSLTPSKIKNAGTKSGGMWEEPLLEEFYSYFSFGNLASTVKGVDVLESQDKGCFLELKITVTNTSTGEDVLHVLAGKEGFCLKGKQEGTHKTLVELMRESSEAFGSKYSDLMKGFKGRNQFGNPPLGLRCNTWAVPPSLSAEPEKRTLLPVESETYSGNIGGILSDRERNWHSEFVQDASMPGHSPAERVARDHKVFLLHSHFVDTAITTACQSAASRKGETVNARNLNITTESEKSQLSSDCGGSSKVTNEERLKTSELALIKGLLADENTIARDVDALAKVQIHFNGLDIKVEANRDAPESEPWTLEQEPALKDNSALNVHGLREFCHSNAESTRKAPSSAELNEILAGAVFEDELTPPKLRWEIVFSWIQYLKNPPSEGPGCLPVKYGLNRRLLLGGGKEGRLGSKEGETELKEKLGEADWTQLAKLNIGLHRKTIVQLMAECNRYYAEIALPRIIHDFRSLELSPIDGQTLTDFMHSRGINMRHIGRLAILSKSLMHIHALCIQEMVVRAAKRIFRIIMSKCSNMSDKAAALAGSLNALLGAEGSQGGTELWDWIHKFVKKRFDFELSTRARSEIRHVALLRDLCQRVGIEVTSRSYDFSSKSPFISGDLVAVVPVCKHIQFTSADGRQLLEQAKAALDKGKLDEAVTTSTSALSKMCAVCGSHSHATANAFSLLAVVLYHTGDFLQAAIYQQKALAVNEREYGLDHPDTIKSYGDLAVFFYRLQHTELALHYVSRALYLLHLTCGADHPNTAATYINVAMMEESQDNVHVALRYLQEALHCNQKLLGPDHVQTAASYHAIAIALSLMDPPLYTLSVQHEQTTLDILESKLGPEDLRTQDAAAWLEYFDLKAVEAQEAKENGNGGGALACNIASKGHLPLKDLLSFLGEKGEGGEQERTRVRTPDSTLYSLSSSETSHSEHESDVEEEMELEEVEEADEREESKAEAPAVSLAVESKVETVSKTWVSHDEAEGEWQTVEDPRRRKNNSKGNKQRNTRENGRENGREKQENKKAGNGGKQRIKQKDNNRERGRVEVEDRNTNTAFRGSTSGGAVMRGGSTSRAVSVGSNSTRTRMRGSFTDVVLGNQIVEEVSALQPSAQAFYPVRRKESFNINAAEFFPRYISLNSPE